MALRSKQQNERETSLVKGYQLGEIGLYWCQYHILNLAHVLGKHGCRISQDSRRDDCDMSLSHLLKEMLDLPQPIRRATPSSPSLKLGTIHKNYGSKYKYSNSKTFQHLYASKMCSYFNICLTSVFKSDKTDSVLLVVDEQYQETLK